MKNELSLDELHHVAGLARLEISTVDEENFIKHINDVLKYEKLLSQIELEEVVPFYSPSNEFFDLYTSEFISHRDVIRPSLSSDDLLRNAPDQYQNQYAVEAVIEEN